MSEEAASPPGGAEARTAKGEPAGRAKQSERDQRLAAALRENLRKRKAQSRDRRAGAAAAASDKGNS